MLFLKDKVSDKSLSWGHETQLTVIRNMKLSGCEITLTCPARGIIIDNVEFNECTLIAKRPFSNFQFFHASFNGRRFIGKFPGCEFGYRKVFPSRSLKGQVIHCDFSSAELDMVAFNGADITTMQLPAWPHFAILAPLAFTEIREMADDSEWTQGAQVPWPSEMSALIRIYRNTGPNAFTTPLETAHDALRSHPHLFLLK